MATFTPPTADLVPPVSVADERYGPSTAMVNPAGYRLMRHYPARARGLNVFKMSDGTYQISQAVPGITVKVGEPYPATTPDLVNNGALAYSYYDTTVTEVGLPDPYVVTIYYGGHSYDVSGDEANALTGAGFGSYLT